MPEDPLAARILEFARDPGRGDFERLALEIFERQFATLPEYREHCEALGATPAAVRRWTEIPAMELASSPEGSFDSATSRRLFSAALPELFDPDRLRLLVGPPDGPPSAAILLDALGRNAPPDSLVASERLDAKRLRSWLGARQRDRRPVCVVSDPAGFERLLAVLERRAVKFRLPPGSGAFCAIPFESAIANPEGSWGEPLLSSLGLPGEACRRVLAGSGFSTPLIEHAAPATGRYRLPHWVRVAPSEPGWLALVDLGSLDTPPRRFETDSGLELA